MRSSLLLTALICLPSLHAQQFVGLDFSDQIEANNAWNPNGSTLGPAYFNGYDLHFRNVGNVGGSSFDARASFIGLTDGETSEFRPTSTYQWVGWLGNYDSNAGQPAGDLGVYYRHDGNPGQLVGGVAYTLSFYVGDGTFSTPIVLPSLRLLIYDHDGEATQSESIRLFTSDGFVGYQLHQGSGIHTHHEGTASVRFDTDNEGRSETSPEGGFIAYFENTSSIRFDHFSTTAAGAPPQNSGVFAAIDGDLSLTGGSTDSFRPYVAVPEPSSLSLAALACLLLLRRRVHR